MNVSLETLERTTFGKTLKFTRRRRWLLSRRRGSGGGQLLQIVSHHPWGANWMVHLEDGTATVVGLSQRIYVLRAP